MSAEGWSYYTLAVKVPDVKALDDRLNALGALGWELVTSVTTVKSWVNMTGNDLVFVFRKSGAGQRDEADALIRSMYYPDAAY